jgi:hypothetical protein
MSFIITNAAQKAVIVIKELKKPTTILLPSQRIIPYNHNWQHPCYTIWMPCVPKRKVQHLLKTPTPQRTRPRGPSS